MSHSVEITIDVDGIEVELEVDVDGEAYEAPSMEGPGSPGGVWAEEVRFLSTGNEVPDIFWKRHSEQIDEKVQERVDDDNNDAELEAEISREQDMEDYYDAKYGDGPW